jgi:kumamolisin
MYDRARHSVSVTHLWQGLCAAIVASILLTACGFGSTSSSPNATATKTASSNPVALTPLNLGLPAQALNAPITGTVPANQNLHVSITFKINQDQLNKATGNGSSANSNSGKTINSNDLAKKIGISDSTYAKIKQYFGVQNITLKLNKLHTNLTVDAKSSTFARLLHTSFVYHKLDGRTYYTPDPAHLPKIPQFIANDILSITGLDNYSTPPQTGFSLLPQKTTRAQGYQTRSISSGSKRANADCQVDSQEEVLPQTVAHAYGYDQFYHAGWTGQNMTVNFVEIDGFVPSDLENYFSCVNYKGRFQYANVDTDAPAAEGEANLDIEMVAGLDANANINVYQTDISQAQTDSDVWTQVNDELQAIINNNSNNTPPGSVVSISLGGAEQGLTSTNFSAIDQSIEVLTKAEHMTVFVSSGDCGAFGSRVYRDLATDFPSTDPWAVAVGGTILQPTSSGNRGSEIAWSDGSNTSKCTNQWGTGGGLSSVFKRPSWEQASNLINQQSNGARQTPDVAAIAYNLPIYFQGQWQAVGGTSAAAPIWAAGLLLLNQGIISKKHEFYYGPTLFYQVYDHPGKFHPFYDVTRGNNLYYRAGPGWDYTTGLGTPNLVDFYFDLLS